jgi:hypothetical protein
MPLDAEPKCMTPDRCIIPHGWYRAFCEKCQATKEQKDK